MTGVIRVLYVDDEPDLLEISKLLLEESGDFSVATVESAPAALELLNAEPFDAIVSDYQMPGMDGIRFLVEVRVHHGQVPFILFTGKGREEIVVEALNNGADFYLQKGGEPGAQYAELSHKIRTAVGLYTVSKALGKSEEKYRRIVETANEGIWAMDRQFVTTYVNERMAGILGYTVEEMIGNTIQSFIPVEELAGQQLKLEQRMNGLRGSYERRFRAKDGTTRTCHVSATPVKGDDGSFQGSFAMLTDITDHVHTEEEVRKKHEDLESSYEELTTTSEELCHTMNALAKKENLYRALFHEMLNGVAVHEIICDEGGTPRDYRFIDVNPAFERMTGLSRADVIGRTVREVMPDTEPFWIERYGRVALTGLPDHFDNYSQVLGRFFEVMVYQNARAQFTTVIADVTDRRRAQEQLQESEAHLSEAQKLAKIGSWEYDSASGKISWTRQTFRIFGRDPRMGEPSFEEMTALWHNEDLPAFTEAVRLAEESGTPYDLEQRIITPGGKQKYIRAQGEAVWKNGVVTKLWGTVQDITARKTAEEALIRSQEQVKQKLEALLSPAGDIGTMELADIIDARAVQALMDDFCTLTGIGIAILDLRGNVLVATGWQDICTKFHRVDPRTCMHCNESDVVLSGETAPGTYRMYKCRNNMWDIVTPIVVGGNHVGNLFLGQFLFEDEPVDYEFFRSQARQYGFNEEEYLAALERVPRWSRERVTTVMDFYTRFGGIISTLGYRNIQLARMVTERDRLVNSLQESEEQFRSYFDNAPYGVFITDQEGHYLEVNPAASGITGYTRDELVSMSIPDMLPPESHEQGIAHFRQLSGIGQASGEFLYRHKDCTLRYWSVNAVRLSPNRFIGFVQDVTERKRSEEALAESEEVFREVFNNANDAIFLHEMLPEGFPGRYFRVNDIACTLLGYSREELLAMSPRDIASPGHRLNIPDIVTKIKSKGYATFEAIYQRKDGSFLPVEVSTHLFTLLGREVALSISRDITERKHAEEALGKSERKYRELIECANEAILVAQDGTLKLVNARMAELTGYPERELLSTPFHEFIHPDDRSMVVERYRKRLNGEDIPSRYMFRLTGKDGKIKWVEISSVAVDYEGRPATLNFLNDITERKQIEDALRESEEFNRGLVENIPDMVAVYGHDRKVRFVNPAADGLLGYSENGRVGTDILSYVVPEKRSEIGTLIEERLKSGSTQSLEIEIMRNDGQRKTVITRSTPVQYHDEQAVLLLLTDISDRKALENQLMTRAEELTRLSLSLAMANKKLNLLGSLTRHDIINKLTLISGYTSQLKKRAPDPELAPYFAKQEDAVRRINDYLQFTKTYEAIGINTPAWLDVKAMVRRGFAAVPHEGITLESDLDGITVYADPLFEKIFPNLLDNSVRHGGHVTRVRVYTREADGELTLYWEDNGTGVPADEKERIFERGYGKNTGLGLFLATDILYITGITIHETGEPGRGARFEIALPKGMWRKE